MKASEQYFPVVPVYHLHCGSKHGIIVVILTIFITSNHSIACSWPSESKELCELKKVRENRGGRLEQANHS